MHAVDALDAETLHQPIVEHGFGAAADLFGRLEDQRDGTGEIAGLGEIFRGAEQHRGVPVMAAGMHMARRLRRIGLAGFLDDRQRVHVGAQPDHRALSQPAADDRDNARAADTGDDVVATGRTQLFGNKSGGARKVEADLGLLMQQPAPAGNILLHLARAVEDRHGGSLSVGRCPTLGVDCRNRQSRPVNYSMPSAAL